MSKDKFSPNAINSIKDDWGKDANDSNGRGFSGQSVQDFIKAQLNSKMGTFYHDEQNNVYLCFASDDALKEYLEDTSKTDLILGRFDAPLNYSVSIDYKNPIRNIVFTGSTGNVLNFGFSIKDKNNNDTGESVTVVYTVTKDKIVTTYTNIYDYGTEVNKNIDEWLKEGTTTINIKVTGNNTLASNSITVTFMMVNLSLEDEYNVSNVVTDGSIAIPYTISGYGTKYMEWYLDGQKVEYNQDEDEILQASSSNTKYIDVTSLSNGLHTVQFRAYIIVDGDKLYSDIHVITAIVHAANTNFNNNTVLALKYIVPKINGINESINPKEFNIYNATQFVPYDITFGTYSDKSIAKTNVQIYIIYGNESTPTDNDLYSSITSSNNKVNNVNITFVKTGDAKVVFSLGEDNVYSGSGNVDKNSNNIQEITADLDFLLTAKGRTNSSSNKDNYIYNNHDVTFIDFAWNNTSGWVDNSLKFNSGNSINCGITPLKDDAMAKGKTFEFYIKSSAVFDDDYVFFDLTTDGHGIKLTASDFIVTSEGGKSIHVNYPTDEYVRLTAVINRRTGATNKGLMFIYVNGEITAAVNVILSDYIRCDKQLLISASDDAKLDIKEIRIYNAPLSAEQVLNNYILCQDTVEDMSKIYDRNDVLDESGSGLSIDKLSTQCPVMIIIGSIPTLENTNNKKEQITVDVQYINVQDPTKSFSMKNAAMRPQGTSSMSYPKKNFKLYTHQLDNTEVYDYEGNLIESKLYAFKDKAQPVDTWCLKADYAESSGTHNTGIARLWNQVMYDALIDGEYKLRTAAQNAAVTAAYPYDVRTTVDGFPINLFYRLNENSELVYIGKYNFNNDKSTESVYGFRDIPGFDNSNVECWEVLNNGDAIALFKSVINFDKLWTNAFEARYPDGSTKIDNLKAFCTWVSKANGKAATFKTQKWEHLDVYKVAAYYVYLMRFCAVDQTVKNAMITTEDGQHYFFINYDNDTINGVINTGELSAPYDTDRNTVGSDGSYIFAGHESVLWNMLEQDEEFRNIVIKVDAALYQAGLTYDKVIDMFDNKQAGAWNKRIYNRDAQYKYLTPYTSNGINNLFMLQGSRSTHRKYFLKKRFNLFDSMFVSGALKSNVFEIKFTNDTPANQQFTITAGTKLYYGYGINELITESGIKLETDESHTFSTPRVLNLGDPVRIYGVTELQSIDLSSCSDRINQLSVNSSINCPYITSLILGGDKVNAAVNEISGITKCVNLKTLDIRGYKAITSLDLSQLPNIEKIYLNNSGVSNIEFAAGANINYIQFNDKFTAINFESLPNLSINGLDNINWDNVNSISIIDCPNLTSSDTIFKNWLSAHTTYNSNTNIIMDNIDWKCTAAQLIKYGDIKSAGGTLNLKGKITINSITQEDFNSITEIYGDNVFSADNELWISAPDSILISGPTSVYEGESYKYTFGIFSQEQGGTNKVIVTGLKGDDSWNDDNTTLTLVEQGSSRTITIDVIHEAPSGKLSRATYSINAKTVNYNVPSSVSFESVNDTTSKFMVTMSTTGQRQNITNIVLDDTLAAKFTITETNLKEGYLLCTNETITDIITGYVTVYYQYRYGDYTDSKRLNVECINSNMLLTKNNTSFLTNLYNKGIISNKTYITPQEVAILTTADIKNSEIKIYNQTDAKFFDYLNVDYLYINKLTTYVNLTLDKHLFVIYTLFSYGSIVKLPMIDGSAYIYDNSIIYTSYMAYVGNSGSDNGLYYVELNCIRSIVGSDYIYANKIKYNTKCNYISDTSIFGNMSSLVTVEDINKYITKSYIIDGKEEHVTIKDNTFALFLKSDYISSVYLNPKAINVINNIRKELYKETNNIYINNTSTDIYYDAEQLKELTYIYSNDIITFKSKTDTIGFANIPELKNIFIITNKHNYIYAPNMILLYNVMNLVIIKHGNLKEYDNIYTVSYSIELYDNSITDKYVIHNLYIYSSDKSFYITSSNITVEHLYLCNPNISTYNKISKNVENIHVFSDKNITINEGASATIIKDMTTDNNPWIDYEYFLKN